MIELNFLAKEMPHLLVAIRIAESADAFKM